MQSRKTWGLALLAIAPIAASYAQSTSGTDAAALEKKLEEQEQRLKILERKLELNDEAAQAAAQSASAAKAAPSGFSIQSADGANVVRLKGNFAFDGRFFHDDVTPSTADTWLLRNVRPTIEGTLNNIYDFRLTPEFGGGRSYILDAYVAGRFKPWFVVQAGKFKGPVGLERLQADGDVRFVERGYPSNLLPNRDIGVQLSGDVLGGRLSYAIGYFDGTLDGKNTDNNSTPDADVDGRRDWEGRLFAQPFLLSNNFYLRGLGFGIGATYTNSEYRPLPSATSAVAPNATNTLLTSYVTTGQQSVFSFRSNTATGTAPNNATYADGKRLRWSPQAYYYVGSFGVLGEYAVVSQDVSRQVSATVKRSDAVDIKAWQVAAFYLLTGEEESYRGTVTPNNNFAIGKPGWGAFELAARYNRLDIDDAVFAGGATSFANTATAVHRASAYAVGATWYLNRNVKWLLNYELTKFDGGATGGDRGDEKVFLTRFYLQF